MYKAAIFDMDGTILDTIEDLRDAINYSFEQAGHKHDFTSLEAKALFGSGVDVAIMRGLALESGISITELVKIGTDEPVAGLVTDEHEVAKIRTIYRPYYETHCAIKTGPYKGILEVIQKLREHGIKTAVVSNKPHEAVLTLSENHFKGLFDFSLGEKAGIARKPAKDMACEAMRILNVNPKDTVYIGDSEIDILTAKNSGIDCISVDWGFRDRDFLTPYHTTITSTMDDLYQQITK